MKLFSTVNRSKNSGFSLIEVMVVVAILLILFLIWQFPYRRHLMKSRDVQRKSDLYDIKLAYEDYYNDNSCYPAPSELLACGEPLGDSPPYYLKQIPCDPQTGDPYIAFSLNEDPCQGYKILAKLEIEEDPDIEAVGCDNVLGCGWEDINYNYGVVMGDSMISPNWIVGDGESIYGCVLSGAKYSCQNLSLEVIYNDYDCPKLYMGADATSRCQDECCAGICPTSEYVSGVTCDEQ